MIRVKVAILFAAMVALLAGCVPGGIIERLESLETRVAAVEGVLTPSRTPPAPSPSPTMPAETPGTPSATATRVATASRTSSPSLTPTATPTGTPTPTPTRAPSATPSAARLDVQAPGTFAPASTVVLSLRWHGPTARVVMTLPREKVGYYDAPGDCGATCWVATDGWTHNAQVWMYSTWRAGETATFTATAIVGDEVAASWVGILQCAVGATATPTVARTPTPTATRAQTALVWNARSWQFVSNPTGAATLWVKPCGRPVGTPGGDVWSCNAAFVALDVEHPSAETWLVLETGGGDVWLWVDTFSALEVCEMALRGRETWPPDCTPKWWGPPDRGYPVCE